MLGSDLKAGVCRKYRRIPEIDKHGLRALASQDDHRLYRVPNNVCYKQARLLFSPMVRFILLIRQNGTLRAELDDAGRAEMTVKGFAITDGIIMMEARWSPLDIRRARGRRLGLR